VAQAETHLRRGAGELVLTSETYVGNWYVQGILLAFEHDGFDARVDRDIADTFGPARVRDPHAAVQANLLVLAGSEIMGYRGRSGYHVIGFGGRRSLAATLAAGRRYEARRQHLTELEQQGRISKETFARRLVSLPQGPVAVLILRRDT
jgi:hypothetical protein